MEKTSKEDQKQVWENISKEWHEFKQNPSKNAQEFLKNKKGKILDLGSGSGRNIIDLDLKNKEMYLVDFSANMIDLAEKRAKELGVEKSIKGYVASIDSLPFENNFFDYAICVAALHCIETPEARAEVIEELFRALKFGGEAEIEVWNKDSERFKNAPKEKFVSWRDKGERYYYLYTKEEIINLFKSKGFEIKEELEHRVNIGFIVKKPENEKQN
ncbi:MAG TPA: class I SAM-dependent methyltransferase [Candidatus Nanoarchaeia archaeon]|nr:class I SAM-dependent methyltransferase [Candidatus Nanoarchaeia archaeon]